MVHVHAIRIVAWLVGIWVIIGALVHSGTPADVMKLAENATFINGLLVIWIGHLQAKYYELKNQVTKPD